MSDDIKLIAGLDIDPSSKQIEADIKKLKIPNITIETVLFITDEVIKKHLGDIQKTVNSQKAIKIKTELDGKSINLSKTESEVTKSSKKLQEIYSQMSKEIGNKIAETFGITDKKAIGELSKLSSEWIKLSDSLSKSNIENDIFENTYQAIKGFDSIINDAQDTYKEFVDYVNNSKIKMQPFGSDYEEMRRSFGVGNVSSKSGLPMDVFYQEARERFSFLPDITNAEDQMRVIADILKRGRDSLKPNKITDDEIRSYFGGEDGIKNALSEILGELSIAKETINEAVIFNASADTGGLLDENKISESYSNMAQTIINNNESIVESSNNSRHQVIQNLELIASKIEELQQDNFTRWKINRW